MSENNGFFDMVRGLFGAAAETTHGVRETADAAQNGEWGQVIIPGITSILGFLMGNKLPGGIWSTLLMVGVGLWAGMKLKGFLADSFNASAETDAPEASLMMESEPAPEPT